VFCTSSNFSHFPDAEDVSGFYLKMYDGLRGDGNLHAREVQLCAFFLSKPFGAWSKLQGIALPIAQKEQPKGKADGGCM
jgi:hypothetical protein